MNKTTHLFLFEFQKIKPEDACRLFLHLGLKAQYKNSPDTHLSLRDAYKAGIYEHGKKLCYLTALLAHKILQVVKNDQGMPLLHIQTDTDFYWRAHLSKDLSANTLSTLRLIEQYNLLDIAHVLAPYRFILKYGEDIPLEALDKKNIQEAPGEYFHEVLPGILNNPLATRASQIPEGQGPFGLCQENPIPLHGTCHITDYLQLLKLKGSDEEYLFEESFLLQGNDIISSQIIPYKIYSSDKTEICTLYFSPYNWANSTGIPEGFERSGTRKHARKKPFELPLGWRNNESSGQGLNIDKDSGSMK